MAKPPYLQLCDRVLEDYIYSRKIPIGGQFPTVRELMDSYEVSPHTMTKALSVLETEGWITKRQGSGIFLASYDPKGGSKRLLSRKTIGCIIPSLQGTIVHRIIAGIERKASEIGWSVRIVSSHFDPARERALLEEMQQMKLEGVILYPAFNRRSVPDYLGSELQDFNIVVVDLVEKTMNRSCVVFDNQRAGYEMTKSLLSLGHQSFAFINYGENELYPSVNDRIQGYTQALEEASPKCTSRVLNFNILHSDEAQSQKNFDRAIETFIELKSRPQVLILPTDQWARRAVYRLRQKSVQVPSAVQVVGFDNLHYEDWDEKITTTQPDFVLMGERSVEVLQDEIRSKSRMRTKLVLPCPIIAGTSL